MRRRPLQRIGRAQCFRRARRYTYGVYRVEMQRLFTMFPAGVPGLALVLLRMGVIGSLWGPTLERGLPDCLPLLGLATASALLLAGFGTPLAAGVAAAIQLAEIFDRTRPGVSFAPQVLTAAIHAASGLALALLGPGAFSIDARLFGRKILTSSRHATR